MKNGFKLGLIFLFFLSACGGARYVPLKPEIYPLNLKPVIPLKAALYIPQDTRGYLYHSPDYIPSQPFPNFDSLRPFVLPVGGALAEAAPRTFSHIFQELQVVEDFPSGDAYPLIMELKLVRFDLRLQYAVFSYRRDGHQLDVEGNVRVQLRLTQTGKNVWEKEYEILISPERQALNPWSPEVIGNQVASSLSLLFGNMAADLTGQMDQPQEPLRQWLINN